MQRHILNAQLVEKKEAEEKARKKEEKVKEAIKEDIEVEKELTKEDVKAMFAHCNVVELGSLKVS
jgi:hypothetical protein